MYDWAHGCSDSIEKITYSICTLEFEAHRPLYDWYLRELGIFPSRQIEFARLNLTYTIMSKRKLLMLVEEGKVTGWNDPLMPTISGLRRRGYTPESIRQFAATIGVAKKDNRVSIDLLDHCLREDLNKRAPRFMGVLDPLKVVIENYPEDREEELEAINNPEDESMGTRMLPFSRELWIERGDFMEDPPRKFFRLAPGREVRLKHAYFITCNEAIKDEEGNIVELRCTYDPETKGGDAPDGRKVRGTLHWVSAKHAADATVRLYGRLFTKENPDDVEEGETFMDYVSPDALEELVHCKVEPALKASEPGRHFQFLRHGYFCEDTDSAEGALVFNRTVSLRDTWAKIQKKQG
jgi:glutaminyl-tRNA synthetase